MFFVIFTFILFFKYIMFWLHFTKLLLHKNNIAYRDLFGSSRSAVYCLEQGDNFYLN